jgi:hypothetical protein
VRENSVAILDELAMLPDGAIGLNVFISDFEASSIVIGISRPSLASSPLLLCQAPRINSGGLW